MKLKSVCSKIKKQIPLENYAIFKTRLAMQNW